MTKRRELATARFFPQLLITTDHPSSLHASESGGLDCKL